MTALVVMSASAGEYVTARDLLAPEMFPDASFGMAVENVEDGAVAQVTTTGGVFRIRKALDTIECDQRIPAPRQVAALKLPSGSLRDIELTHHSAGAVVFKGAGTTLRINGDSTLMVAPGQDGDIRAKLAFPPDCHFGAGGNHNFFDPYGGISFFDNGNSPEPHLDLEGTPITVTWELARRSRLLERRQPAQTVRLGRQFPALRGTGIQPSAIRLSLRRRNRGSLQTGEYPVSALRDAVVEGMADGSDAARPRKIGARHQDRSRTRDESDCLHNTRMVPQEHAPRT